MRDEPRRAVDGVVLFDEQRCFGQKIPKLRADEGIEPLARDGHPEQEQAKQHRQLVRVAEPPEVSRQLGRSREQLVTCRQALLDSLRLIPCAPQQSGKPDRRIGVLRARRVRPGSRADDPDGLHVWVAALRLR